MPSYISILGGIGNIEPLLFEAAINPYYMLHKNNKWGLEFSTKVILRMYDEFSCPIRTPSYMPRITSYFNASGSKKQYEPILYVSWCHHSNGQDGSFYREDDSTCINTFSGDFSTNMVEIGAFMSEAVKMRGDNLLMFRCSAEYHYQQSVELKELYGNYRLNNEVRVIWYPWKKSHKGFSVDERNFSIRTMLKLQWIAGEMKGAPVFDANRLTVSLQIAMHPLFLEQVSFFGQYYYGQDYYNIYFARTLKLVRFGILADISNR